MMKLIAVIAALLGLGATVWNTVSVEKKSVALEETEAIVNAIDEDIATREMHYRLAVQEYNFSTLHAANAYELDSNAKLLSVSVAPGTTILQHKKAIEATTEKQRISHLDRAKLKIDTRKLEKQLQKQKQKPKPKPKPKEPAKAKPKAEVKPAMKSTVKPAMRMKTRTPVFARFFEFGKPQTAPKPGTPPPGGPKPGGPKPGGEPSFRRLRAVLAPAAARMSAARPHVKTPVTRQKVEMIRGFQIENLSRWRQYIHVASTGEPMTEEEVGQWEGLLAEALVEGKDSAMKQFVSDCSTFVQEWESNRDEGRAALADQVEQRSALDKQIDRSKSIYMGLMLLGLVLVTVKDVFSKEEK